MSKTVEKMVHCYVVPFLTKDELREYLLLDVSMTFVVNCFTYMAPFNM